MKKTLSLLAIAVLFGAGCIGASSPAQVPSQPAAQTPPQAQAPQMTSTGCTPKSIIVLEPTPGAALKLPIKVRAIVNNSEHPDCRWSVFEAVAGPMRLLDKDGVTVGTGRLTATGDWMTDGPVEFTGEIPALAVVEGSATLVITEDNAADKPDPQEVMIPLTMMR